MKDEMTIVLHLYEGALELTVLILIPVIALATVERKMIDARHIHIVGTTQKFVVFAESLNHLLQHLFPIHLMPQNLSQRYRVGRIAVELSLIDINADTEDAALDALGVDGSLYQRATDLLVIPVHIIRPFQRNAVRIGIKSVLHGERTSLGKEELLAQRYPLRTHHHTEEEVLARLTLPGMHALSPACCLIVSNGNGQRIFIVSIQILQEGIRGIHFL